MKRVFETVFQYCPGCGKSNLRMAEDQSVMCGACGFHFFFNASAAVVALIEDNGGRIILTRRAKDPAEGMMDLPGGFVDMGETAEQALYREIKEELGAHITQSRYLFSTPGTYLYDNVTYAILNLVYLCTIERMDTLRPGDDVGEVILMEKAKIDLDQIGLESIKYILQQILEDRYSLNRR